MYRAMKHWHQVYSSKLTRRAVWAQATTELRLWKQASALGIWRLHRLNWRETFGIKQTAQRQPTPALRMSRLNNLSSQDRATSSSKHSKIVLDMNAGASDRSVGPKSSRRTPRQIVSAACGQYERPALSSRGEIKERLKVAQMSDAQSHCFLQRLSLLQ